jgi:phosphate:Na+ symporter
MFSIVWEMLVGLGIFLYGMSRLENGIGALSGAQMKSWLARSTASPLASASFGALVTTILQSSSMVGLLVLAFASAGSMPLYNAIGVLIGTNLGTTATGWIVATLGFKLDFATLALPLIGIGGLMQVLTKPERRLYAWGKMATGLGLLLFGLMLMKDRVGDLSLQWDIQLLQDYHPVIYLLAGVLVTALIQSSSATVMLTLTALNASLINLPEAGALVIGANLGTTGTTVLASMNGPGIKRQLALAQLTFNAVVGLFAFFLLLPILPMTAQWLGILDPLYGVVAFHTALNLLGVAAFLPFLKPFSQWIERFFKSPVDSVTRLAEIPVPIPEAALPAMVQALRDLWLMAAANTMHLLAIPPNQLSISPGHLKTLSDAAKVLDGDTRHLQVYQKIKHQEAAIVQLAYKLQQQRLDNLQSRHLGLMQELARGIVYASKTIQDIANDIQQLHNAHQFTSNTANWQLTQQQTFLRELYSNLLPAIIDKQDSGYLQEQLKDLERRNDQHFQDMNEGVYQRAPNALKSEPELSIQLNVNWAILHAIRSLLHSTELWQAIIDDTAQISIAPLP